MLMRVKLTRTVVLESYPLTKKKFKAVKEVYSDYSKLLTILTEYAFENGIRNPVKLRNSIPPEVKVKYELPSHYYYTACQDAVARVKGFLEKKRKGKARTEKPVVRRVSVWLDDVLWDYKRFPQFNTLKNGKKILIIRLTSKRTNKTPPKTAQAIQVFE